MRDIQRISAEPGDKGLRLDAFLAKRLKGLSRAQVCRLIRAGAVAMDGMVVKPSRTILGDEAIVVQQSPTSASSSLLPQAIPLDVIHCDDHIAVIDKPAGLTVHPGAGISDGTLCNALLHLFPHMWIGDQNRPGLVHRLDRDTSGVMVVALTHEAHRILSDDFKNRRVKKIYRAFTWGEMDKDAFELRTGHVRHPHNRLKFFTGLSAPRIPSTGVRLAHTGIEVQGRSSGMTEVRAMLHTGRTHQIRAHLADIGHPLVGDKLYGGARLGLNHHVAEALSALYGHALHAELLRIKHPIKKTDEEFMARVPERLTKLASLFV